MLKNKRVLAIIAIVIILLLLWFIFQPVEEATITSEWTEISSHSGGAKLHEEQDGMPTIRFDDCCDGQAKVTFRHGWDFYFDDNPEDCCHNPVVWKLRDSLGQVVFTCSELCPGTRTETITSGVWDCINPWIINVDNGCLYPINYNYELTMYCLESGSSDAGGFDFWDWITFWD